MYQTIIIGGGPSGLMAAVAASENSSNVLLIEKKKGLGRKLKISGGGRCNVTNRLPYEEIIKNIPGNGKFLYSPFSKFDNESIIEFFESRGIKLKEEDHGRMFPVSNKSQDIVDTLVNTIKNNNVEIKEETVVNDISKNDQSFIVKTQDGEFESKTVIIATGGTSVPQTGSTGDGYRFAKNLGHTITELFPTEVPITSNESFIKNKTLKGLSLKDVELSVLKKNGKKRISHQMDMIFTHFGVSGPAALRCSQFVYKEQKNQKKQDIQLQLDVFPEISLQDLENKIKKILSEEPDKYIKNALRGLIEERYLLFMLEQANINENTTFHHLSNQQLTHLAEHFKQFIFTVNGTLSIERAFVTGGGVSLKEIWPKTMMSKIQPGLFLCGEVLDIHGYTGGYNITSALVTGHVAGSEARQFIYT
ncbi:aminoacetone oxidase family FAD-binding enzyme [Staphylococcus hominis]|uniref:Aminoacetone oxidase family FAD-binding enzyme n=1 Tax=Staphylococcus hominis TaxID=1290 RepID=A0A974KYG4_STAHO|nr:NAD(P)/FAD-dependent oxidoreductase [Staphylococcus hominis]MCE4951204.1 NAD(P)/FAD-dependent oxidoreductase [Staphylococcus hominis]MCE4974883.1 NAD(P)/FAD-dependent oxidoreductase [Staphylococcus hominis]PTK20943.1 aminoacetone oxidase family FAD-binding enzyme [Staphylococcus hominis]PTK32140.1 aminoacetone oxidase family FAD-binding enzyme [Staphylococcus hominis]PTK36830.1 aminoacetone oxidase family FAD-binding enzyme [Staphylococcus hominis]